MKSSIYSRDEQLDMLWWLKNRHEMPTKYQYFGNGAKRWIAYTMRRLAENSTKSIHVLERMLINKKVGSIFDSLSAYGYKNYNIIDFGCGEGSPTYPIFQYLKTNKPKAILKYNPIDISGDLLDIAARNVRRGFGVSGDRNKWDLDMGNFAHITKTLRRPNMGDLYLFLGATLCNMPDMRQDIINFRESMQQDDYFLLGAELLKEEDVGTIMKEYYSANEIFDLIMTPFEYLGARRSNFTYNVTFNREKSQLEGYMIPERNLRMELAGKELALEKGERIMSYRSVKFTTERLTGLFEQAGFRIELFTTSRDNKYALILAQPAI